jgi:hypothetical protein
MGLRRLALCLVAVASLSACGTAADLAGSGPAPDDRDQTASPSPTEPPTSEPTTAPTSPTESPTTVPTTRTSTPTKRPGERPPKQLPHDVGPVTYFSSPSRNIGCLITQSSVRCDIGQKSYKEPRRPASCQLDYGQAIAVTRDDAEATFVCAGDSVLGAKKVLRYHTSTEVGDFGCTSRETGMTCYNLRTRHGFTISREYADLF